jgi:hypothetical protein
MSVQELIARFMRQERHPDLDLIAALLRQGDAIVPHLIRLVEQGKGWPQIHAALLLCELHAEVALPALRQAMTGPQGHDLADWLDEALPKFGPAALDTLEAIVTDKGVAWYPRAIATRALMNIAYTHPETYERVTAILRGLLPDPGLDWRPYTYEEIKAQFDDPQIWTTAVVHLCELRDPQAYDLIGQLFDAGLVDEISIDRESYEQAYRKTGRPSSMPARPMDLLSRYRQAAGYRQAPVPSPHQQPASRPNDHRPREAMPPSEPPKKSGRNEPCPCGSGKKYKHCHGRQR